MTEPPRAKPQHLAAEFAAQFGDEEVAAAYRHRPPYPPEAFAAPEGHLILVERTLAGPLPWDVELRGLIREYSTNRDYVVYDIVTELERRGLIAVVGRARTEIVAHRQPVDGYVESFHSRNGFSRARLQPGRAQEFDDRLRALVNRACPDGAVTLPVQARIVWTRPVVHGIGG